MRSYFTDDEYIIMDFMGTKNGKLCGLPLLGVGRVGTICTASVECRNDTISCRLDPFGPWFWSFYHFLLQTQQGILIYSMTFL